MGLKPGKHFFEPLMRERTPIYADFQVHDLNPVVDQFRDSLKFRVADSKDPMPCIRLRLAEIDKEPLTAAKTGGQHDLTDS